jgi:hypothetical protein
MVPRELGCVKYHPGVHALIVTVAAMFAAYHPGMTAYSSNVSVTTAATCLWQVKSQSLVGVTLTENWTIVSSATGGVYAQSGDVIDSESDLLSASTWWVMKGKAVRDGSLTVRQQLCWQTNGSGGVRLKVSPRAGFTGGSPSATRVPSATDERVLLGGGTDASPTYSSALFPASGAWFQARYSETDDAIWAMAYPVGGGAASALFVLGCLPLVYDGTGNLIDGAPWVYYAASGSNAALAQGWASESAGPMGLLAYGETSGATQLDAWVRLPASQRAVYDSGGTMQQFVPGHLPQSPSFQTGAYYAQDTMRLGRRLDLAGAVGSMETGNANTCGDKGELCGVRWSGKRFTVPTLLTTTTPYGSAVSSAVGIGDLILPWEAGYSLRDGA